MFSFNYSSFHNTQLILFRNDFQKDKASLYKKFHLYKDLYKDLNIIAKKYEKPNDIILGYVNSIPTFTI